HLYSARGHVDPSARVPCVVRESRWTRLVTCLDISRRWRLRLNDDRICTTQQVVKGWHTELLEFRVDDSLLGHRCSCGLNGALLNKREPLFLAHREALVEVVTD